MIEQAQGILAKSMGVASSPASAIKTLAGTHPLGLGIIVGIGAYYVVNKYLLDTNESAEEEAAVEEAATEEAVST